MTELGARYTVLTRLHKDGLTHWCRQSVNAHNYREAASMRETVFAEGFIPVEIFIYEGWGIRGSIIGDTIEWGVPQPTPPPQNSVTI